MLPNCQRNAICGASSCVDMSISYRRLFKQKCHKTIEYRFKVIYLVSFSFYLHRRFRFTVVIEKRNVVLNEKKTLLRGTGR